MIFNGSEKEDGAFEYSKKPGKGCACAVEQPAGRRVGAEKTVDSAGKGTAGGRTQAAGPGEKRVFFPMPPGGGTHTAGKAAV